MQSTNRTLIIISGAVLLAAFFMPWLKIYVSISAWDIIFGEAGKLVDTPIKYLALLIPISGALIIYGAGISNGEYAIPKGLLFAVPLITLIVLAVVIGNEVGASVPEEVMQVIGMGTWLTLGASLLLPFLTNGPVDNDVPAREKIKEREEVF